MELERLKKENFEEYTKRLVYGKFDKNNIVNDHDYSEIYEYLFEKEISGTESRKRIYGIKDYLEKKDNEIENNNTDIDNKKLNYKETIELNKDGSQTSDKLLIMSQEDCKSPDFLLISHGYNVKDWELVSARNNIWNSYSKQDGIMTLYSSKITVKPLKEYKWNIEDIDKLFEGLELGCKKTTEEIKVDKKSDKILLIPIADLHAGLLSDVYSNGNDYNLDLCEEIFNKTIEDIIETNKNKSFEKVLLILGNDLVNSDNLSMTTTKGTPQQDSNLWFSIVNRVEKMLVNGIDKLCDELNSKVDVIYVPSNHDLHTTYGIMKSLNAWYRLDKNIKVDISPLPRKYYKYGKTILAFSHDVKIKEALKIVSTEAKDLWSDSDRVVFMLAHLHQAMEYEKQGMLEIRRLPTISGYSRWTNTQGYVQNERCNQSFVIDKDLGIIDVHNTVFPN